MADHQPLQELREASRRVLVSIKAVPVRLREALTASPNRVRNRAVAAGCCAAAALLVGAGAWAAAAPGALPVPGEPPAAATRAADDGAAGPVAVALEVSAEGYTEQSSPLVAVVEPVGDARGEGSADDGSASPTEAFAHAVSAEEVSSGTASVDLKPGTYTVSFVSPVNQDGSVYKVPAPVEVTVAAPDALDDGADPEIPKVDVKLDPVPADQVTKEDLDKIKSDLADAVAKGDGTLSGDAGSQATSKAEENASKAPASKPAEGGQKPEEKPAEEKPSDGGQTSGSSGSGSSGGGQSSGGGSSSGGQSSSSGGSSGGGQSSGGSGSSGGGSTAPAKKWVPEKGHYEPVYENVWVPNVSYVRHERWECSSCGNMFSSGDAMDAHVWGTYGDAQHPNGASAIDQSYTETVDNGHYEKKQTGQKWVVDVPGHWE